MQQEPGRQWDAGGYTEIQRHHQNQYGRQLLRASIPFVQQAPANAVDLGCGEGSLTVLLKTRLNASCVLGIDRDAGMLEKAKEHFPGLCFAQADILDWLANGDEPYEYIFSNAVLHWLSTYERFDAFLRHLTPRLAPGGIAALRFSLWDNGLRAKQLLYTCLEDHLRSGQPLSIPACEYHYRPILHRLENSFTLLYAREHRYLPFAANPTLSYQWMIHAQPIGHLLGEDTHGFYGKLYNIWREKPVPVEAHHCEFVLQRRR